MKTIVKLLTAAVLGASLLVAAVPALAATPVLSVTSQGGNMVNVSISNADSNALITLYERQTSSLWTVISNIGQTDYSGYFNQQISLASDGTINPIQAYVVVDGLQSTIVQVSPYGSTSCYYSGCSNGGNGSMSFSPSNVYVTAGQSTTVAINFPYTSSYGYSSGLYLSNNSNASVATASISGSTITVYGQNTGSTTMNFCLNAYGSSYATNYGNGCASLYVTVSGSTTYGNLTLSQSNVSVSAGQNTTISATVSNNYYTTNSTITLYSNSNSSVATASINGSIITVYGSVAGSTTMIFCSNNNSQCANLYVTVTGSVGSLSLSQSSLTITSGQNSTVTIYNTTGTGAYIASNSNSNAVTATINGSTVNLSGYNSGSSTIVICASNNRCANLYVTVNGTSSITFSQNNPSLSIGQSASVNMYSSNGSNSFYISNNSNTGVVSATISGSVVYLVAGNIGSSTLTICQNNYTCGSLYVTVTGSTSNTNVWFTQTNVTVNAGQTVNDTVYSNNSNYSNNFYISNNSNTSVASAIVSGNTVAISGTNSGSTTFTVCQYNYASCASVFVTVSNGNVLGASTYNNGQLISQNGTVYIVYKNTETAFGNANAFLGLGYQFGNVSPSYGSSLINQGFVVSSPYMAHPWGSWIKSGNTVYFVHELGLIPVTDYNTFTSNNGRDSLVVLANTWDFQKSILSPMMWNDARLR